MKQTFYNMQTTPLRCYQIQTQQTLYFNYQIVLKIYEGLEINTLKTEGMWIGSQKNNDEKPLGISWPSEPIKALGIFFTYDQSLLYEKIIQMKLDDMKKLTNTWSFRGLSLYGKVTKINLYLSLNQSTCPHYYQLHQTFLYYSATYINNTTLTANYIH